MKIFFFQDFEGYVDRSKYDLFTVIVFFFFLYRDGVR